jgi:hypothetical protein
LVPAAIAAGVVIVLAGGLWFTLTQVSVFKSHRMVTMNSDGRPTAELGGASDSNLVESNSTRMADASNADDAVDELLGPGVLHHKLPPLSDMTDGAAHRRAYAGISATELVHGPAPSLDTSQTILADFQLELRAVKDEAPNVLARAIEPLPGRAAVVRNLTTENLKRIEAAWYASRAAELRGGDAPMRADVNSSNQRGGNPHVTATTNTAVLNGDMLRESADALIETGLVAGEPALMPGYDTQIELSEAGSVYTIVLPVKELPVMLERLASVHGVQSAMLVMRSDADRPSTNAEAANRWVSDLARVQQCWEQLSRDYPDAAVILPVVVHQ